MRRKALRRAVVPVIEALESRQLFSAQLLKDINLRNPNSISSNVATTSGPVYFQASTSEYGNELWKSDGTAAGTTIVKDIVPGSGSAGATSLTAVGSSLFFVSNGPGVGAELFKTDGTAAGTVNVKDIRPGTSGSSPSNLTNFNGVLFFTTNDGTNGVELWRSDGTSSGTVLVKDMVSGSGSSSPSTLTVANDTLYFIANDGTNGSELWKSDGTSSGTVLVKDIATGSASSNLASFTVFGTSLVFTANDGANGVELWISDGTSSGTTMLKDINSGSASSSPGNLTVLGGDLYFSATTSSQGRELWKTDGTTGGTVIVSDIVSGTGSSNPNSLAVSNGTLFFAAQDSYGVELWKSDGTSTGTVRVKDIVTGGSSSNPTYLVDMNNTLFFVTAVGLWKSDGTGSGTVQLKDINVFGSLANNNGTLFFSGYSAATGAELWSSDGTTAGTSMVKDITPGTSSAVSGALVKMAGTTFFTADDGVTSTELWKTDGSTAGTVLVKDIATSGGSNPQNFTVVGSGIYFSASDATNGRELWKSDGTSSGTVLVKNITSGSGSTTFGDFIERDGIVYFAANDGTNGSELWRSDGTSSGTYLVADINSGSASSTPFNLVSMGSSIYFMATDPTYGTELWKSDGTSAGTTLVKDINTGSGSSVTGASPGLTAFQGALYLEAYSATYGSEIWKSDGTTAGTDILKDINPGTGWGVNVWNMSFPALGNNLYFGARNSSGLELWKTDGTSSGTVMVKDIAPSSVWSFIDNIGVANNHVFFSIDDGTHGQDLWMSDGTSSGTNLLKDINPGSADSLPSQYTAVGDIVFFSATSSATGTELWRTDGTTDGTQLVKDIAVGTVNGLPLNLMNLNGSLLFSASNDAYGRELWAVMPPSVTLATQSVIEHSTVQLHVDQASDPDPGETLSYSWDLDGDGVFGETGTSAGNGNETGATPTFSASNLNGVGSVQVAVRVANSTGLSATTYGLVNVVSAAPTGLTAVATSPSAISLGWGDNSSIETGFAIDRSTDNVSWTTIHTTSSNVTSYSDTSLAPGTHYYYRVKAFNAAGQSAPATADVFTKPADLSPWIDGPDSVNEGSPYVLQLHNDGSTAATSWTINWNDGTSPQTVTGSPTTVTHTYADGPLAPHITATVTDGTATVAAAFRALDRTFDSDGKTVTVFPANNATPLASAKDSSGRIVVAGTAYSYVTGYDLALARYNTDGSLDTSFGSGGKLLDDLGTNDDESYAIAIQADGKILVAGRSNTGGSAGYDFVVVRYNSNGTRDTGFGTGGVTRIDWGGTDYGNGIYLQSTGKIIVVGQSGGGGNGTNFGAARLNSDGTLDTTFGDSGTGKKNIDFAGNNDVAIGVVIDSNDSIYAVGKAYVSSSNGNDAAVVKLNSDGSVDTSFGTSGKTILNWGDTSDSANAIALDGDGKLIIAGVNGSRTMVTRLLSNGTVDTSFGTSGIGYVWSAWCGFRSVKLQSDGKIVLAGNSIDSFMIARLNSNGTADTSFGSGGRVLTNYGINEYNNAMVILNDGRIVAVGPSMIGVERKFVLTGFTSSGAADSGFGTNGITTTDFVAAQGRPYAIAFDGQGRTLVAGGGPGSGWDGYVARYLADGSLDSTFGSGGRLFINDGYWDDRIFAIRALSNGKILTISAANISNAVGFMAHRLNSDGSIDTSFGTNGSTFITFGSGVGAWPAGVDIDSSGRIVIVGVASGTSEASIALTRLSANGTLDTSFGTSGKTLLASNTIVNFTNGNIGYDNVHIDADGKIRVVLCQTMRTVRFTADGVLDTSFGSGGYAGNYGFWGGNNFQARVAFQPDGKAIVVNSAYGNSGDVDMSAARLNTNGTLDTSFGSSGYRSVPLSGNQAATAVAIASDGKILLAGMTGSNSLNIHNSSASSDANFAVARLTSSGSIDTTFGNNGVLTTDFNGLGDYATAAAIDPNGKLLVAGVSRAADGTEGFAVARYNLDQTIAVNNVAPTLAISGIETSMESHPYTLNLSSSDPGVDTITGWTINWGDGNTQSVTGNPGSVTHVYTTVGANHVITASASDEDGTYSSSNSLSVLVTVNTSPTSTLTNSGPVNEGSTAYVGFGSVSDDSADMAAGFIYSFDFDNDGSFEVSGSSSAVEVPAEMTADGTASHVIHGRVEDQYGAYSDYYTTLQVSNVAPTLEIVGNAAAVEGQQYTLNLSVVDPGTDTISRWVIDWGDGNTQTIAGQPSALNHTYASAGNIVINASAEDEDGTYASNPLTLTVVAAIPTVISVTQSGTNNVLQWNDGTTGESGFAIQRRTASDGTWSALDTVGSNQTSYTDTTAAQGVTYYYRVQPIGGIGVPGWSNSGSVGASNSGSSVPASITNLRLVHDTGTSGNPASNDLLLAGDVVRTDTGPAIVEFDVNGDGVADGSVTADAQNRFVLDLNGYVVSPGAVAVKARVGVADPVTANAVFSGWSLLSFNYVATETSLPDPASHVPTLAVEATFANLYLKPVLTSGADGSTPTDFTGGYVFGGAFASFGNRFNPTGGNSFTSQVADTDNTPVLTSYSTSNGLYSVSTSDLSAMSIVSSVSGSGAWTYSENSSFDFTIITSFSGIDGSHSSRIQTGHYEYSFDANSTSNGSTYSLNDDYTQSYLYDWASSVANPEHKYSANGSETYSRYSTGTMISSNAVPSTSEVTTYDAFGFDKNTNKGTGATWSNDDTTDDSWTYSVSRNQSSSQPGKAASNDVSTFKDSRTRTYDDKEYTDHDTTENKNGKSVHSYGTGYVDLNGGSTEVVDVFAQKIVNEDGTWTANPHVNYTKDTSDHYEQAGSSSVDSVDNSIADVSVAASSTLETTSTQDRGYTQTTNGYTYLTNTGMADFHGDTDESSTVTAAWTTSSDSSTDGTDNSEAGYKGTLSSNHQTTDEGTSSYSTAGSGTFKVSPSGVASATGTNSVLYTSDGKTTWDNTDSSSRVGGGTSGSSDLSTKTTVANYSSAADSGTGEYHTYSLNQAIGDGNGVVIRTATTGNTAETTGKHTEDHDFDSTVVTTDTTQYGIEKTTTAKSHETASPVTNYTTTSSLQATTGASSSNSVETDTRDETGTTASHRSASNTTVVDDQRTDVDPDVAIESSSVATTVEYDESGTTEGSSLSTVTVADGITSWARSSTSKSDGVNSTATVTDSDSEREIGSVADQSSQSVATPVHETTDTGTHYENTASGKYTISSSSDSDGDPSGSFSKQSSTNSSNGTYDVSSYTRVDYLKDDLSSPLTKHADWYSISSSDGSGTYSSVASTSSEGASDGYFSSTATASSEADDSGTTGFESKSTATSYGVTLDSALKTRTQGDSGTPNKDVYFESRNGSYASHKEDSSESSNINGKYTSSASSSSTWDDSGATNWNQDTDAVTEVDDQTNAEIPTNTKTELHDHSSGNGEYAKHYENGTTRTGSTTVFLSSGTDHQWGDSTFNRTTSTLTSGTDTSKASFTTGSWSQSDIAESGGGSYDSNSTYENDVLADGTHYDFVTSTTTHTSDSSTDGTTHGESTIYGDVWSDSENYSYLDGKGQSASTVVVAETQSNSSAKIDRTSAGSIHTETTDVSTTTNGKTSSSHDLSQTSVGTFSGSSELIKNVAIDRKNAALPSGQDDEFGDAGNIVTTHGNEYTYSLTKYENGKYTSEYDQHDSTDTAGKSASSTFNQYSEEATFDTQGLTQKEGDGKVYTSLKAEDWRQTLQDKTVSSFHVTDGFYSSTAEDYLNGNADGKSTSYHNDGHYEEGSTTHQDVSDQHAKSHLDEFDAQGVLKLLNDSETVSHNAVNFTNGQYTSYNYNHWATDENNVTTTTGQSKDEQSSDYAWDSSSTTTGTVTTPEGDPNSADGTYVGVWHSTDDLASSKGTGHSSSLLTTDTGDGQTETHSESEDTSQGTYDRTVSADESVDETNRLIAWDNDPAARRTSHAQGTSSTHTTGSTTSHTTESSDKTETELAVLTFTSTSSDEQTNAGHDDWSKSSSSNGTEHGTVIDLGIVTKTGSSSDSQSGDDDFDLSTTTTATSQLDGSWTKQVETDDSGGGTSQWSTSSSLKAESELAGDGSKSFINTDGSADAGEGNYVFSSQWTTKTNSVDAEAVTTGKGYNEIHSEGTYSSSQDREINVQKYKTVDPTNNAKYTIRYAGKEDIESVEGGHYTINGNTTVTRTYQEDGGGLLGGPGVVETYTGQVARTDEHTNIVEHYRTVTDKVEDQHQDEQDRTVTSHTRTTDYMGTMDVTPAAASTIITLQQDGTPQTTFNADTTGATKHYDVKGTRAKGSGHAYRGEVEFDWSGKANLQSREVPYTQSLEEIILGLPDYRVDRTETFEYDMTNCYAGVANEGLLSGVEYGIQIHPELGWYNDIPLSLSSQSGKITRRTIRTAEGETTLEVNDRTSYQFDDSDEVTVTVGDPYETYHLKATRSLSGPWTLNELDNHQHWVTYPYGEQVSDVHEYLDGTTVKYHQTRTNDPEYNGGTYVYDLDNPASSYNVAARGNAWGTQTLSYNWSDTINNWAYDNWKIDLAAIEEKIVDAYQTYVDFEAGLVHGAIEALNPVAALGYHVPDFGPIYGHETAYTVGGFAGTAVGLAGSFAIGNVASGASSVVACGSALQTAAKIYTTANTVIGFGAGTYHIAQGKGTFSDYVSVASGAASAIGWIGGKMSGVQNCFVAGTEVLVGSAAAPGVFSEKAIEDIRVGDEVWTKDQNDPNAPLELKQVKQVFIHTAYDLQKVSVTDESTGNVETYDVTDEHPFYVDGLGWTSARELVIGEHLISSDGKIMTVTANVDDQRPDGVTVYNFEVEGDHTYFVADGQGTTDEFVWVHNDCGVGILDARLKVGSSPQKLYEIEKTGRIEYLVGGGGAKIWADGVEGTVLKEAKLISKYGQSPFIQGSSIPNDIRTIIQNDVIDEFTRYGKIIADKSAGFSHLELHTNNVEAAEWFVTMLKELAVPHTVLIH